MAENFKVTHYRNGDPIPTGYDNSSWIALTSGAYAVYNDDADNTSTYGFLYNWYAVDDSRNIAPTGWHIPTDDEWKELEMYLGMSQSESDGTNWRGTNEGSKLAGNAALWIDGVLENNAEFGTSGFTALPGGYRVNNGNFGNMGYGSCFWSSTAYGSTNAWDRIVEWNTSDMYRGRYAKLYGHAVRCVRDSIPTTINISSGEIFGNDTVFVPINVQFPTSATYSSAELTIGGYQSGLGFISVVTDSSLTGDAEWTYSANETGDSLLVSWLAGSQDISGSGVFCWLKFVVNGDGCTFVPVNIVSATFNTGTDSVTITNGGVHIEAVPDYGDADANGSLQAYDASTILKHLVGLDSLNCQGLVNAEVSCSDTVTAYDASLILQKGVGLIDSLPWCEVLLATGDINTDDLIVSAGQAFDYPINISNGENIYSYEGVVRFDSEQITLTNISSPGGDSLSDSLIPGELHFAGASATPHSGDGSIAVLHFTANTNFNDETTISIEKLRLNENQIIDLAATATVVLGIGDEAGIPESYALYQNYPNPFNPITTLRYDLPENSFVRITIYDLLGRKVKTLITQTQEAGFKSIIWNATNDNGKLVSAGVYLYQIRAGEYVQTKKMLLLK